MAEGYAGNAALGTIAAQASYPTSVHPPAALNPSVFNAFEGLQAEALHLLVRASNLADRLCGPRPPSPENGDKSAPPMGLFEETSMHVQAVRGMIAGATAALERIEGKLP